MDHSEHFSRRELACRCGCDACEMDPRLLLLAEKIRVLLGDCPMVVTSGFRCPDHNAAVGGEPDSHHMKGMAMDFYPNGISLREARSRILDAYGVGRLPELGGLGYYPRKGFLHVDVVHAPDGHLRRW